MRIPRGAATILVKGASDKSKKDIVIDVDIVPEELVTTVEYDYPTFHITMHCFLASIRSGEVHLLEHEAARWLAPEELDEVSWLPADIAAVEKLKMLLTRQNVA